jgi:membrane protein implicated in regulation of membrane protease activity
MKHANTILAVGIIFVLMPLLGFPSSWKNFFTLFAGLLLCLLVVMDRFHSRQGRKSRRQKEKFVSSAMPFVENRNSFDSTSEMSSTHNHEQASQ